jgi:membrane protein
VGDWLQRARTFLEDELWYFEPNKRGQLGVVRLIQFSIMVGEGFVRDQLLLRASALTYFAVLSIIPMLAIASAILTAFGITENVLGPVIDQFGAVAPEVASQLRTTIADTNLGALGTVGAASLLLTTVLGISNVERALNHIWGVQHERRVGDRLAYYLTVLILAPLLLGAGLTVATAIKSQAFVAHMLQYPVFAQAYDLGLKQVPTLVFAVTFTAIYAFLPNTKVKPGAAILGGLFSAFALNAAFATYVGYSVGLARAQALYGTFAQLPLLFVWIYLVWAIVLLGAEIAFAFQNLPSYRREVRSRDVSTAEREALALHLAVAVARRFRDGDVPLDTQTASELLDAPVRLVREVEARLTKERILARVVATPDTEALTTGRPGRTRPPARRARTGRPGRGRARRARRNHREGPGQPQPRRPAGLGPAEERH